MEPFPDCPVPGLGGGGYITVGEGAQRPGLMRGLDARGTPAGTASRKWVIDALAAAEQNALGHGPVTHSLQLPGAGPRAPDSTSPVGV